MLTKANLQNANNYYVAAPFDERLRFEIDPKWHGETPTTILVDKNGKATRKTGLTKFSRAASLDDQRFLGFKIMALAITLKKSSRAILDCKIN